jgi:hypothetical protein
MLELRQSITAQFDLWLSIGEKDGNEMIADEFPLLEVLIEMGLDKLQRDLTAWLISGHNLIRSDLLLNYLQPKHLSITKTERVARVKRLLRVLEFWVLCKCNLPGLPADQLRSLVQSVFNFWEKNSADDDLIDKCVLFESAPLSGVQTATMMTALRKASLPATVLIRNENHDFSICLQSVESVMEDDDSKKFSYQTLICSRRLI